MKPRPIGTARKLSFATMAIPLAVLNVPIVIYVAPYYGKELGLGLALTGQIFLAVRLFDALFDVLVGRWSDRTTSRFGRRKPWIAAGIPVMLVATWAICFPPPDPGPIYFALCAGGFYIAWTLIQIPHLALGQDLGGGAVGRGRMSAWRETATMVGTLLATGVPLLIAAGPGVTPAAHALHVLGVVAIVSLALSSVPLMLWVPDTPAPTQRSLERRRVIDLLTHGPFPLVLVALFLSQTAIFAYNGVVLLLVEDDLGLKGWFMLLVFIQYLMSIGCVPFSLIAARQMGFARAMALGIAMFAAGLLLLALPAPTPFTAIPAFCLIGIGVAFKYVLAPALVSDIAKQRESWERVDRVGEHLALLNLVFKLGIAIGTGISLILIATLRQPGLDLDGWLSPGRIVGAYIPVGILVAAVGCFLRVSPSRTR